jgi:hypothetical protein
MSLFAILLTSLFLFGFAVAAISAPSCLATWEWVSMLSYLLVDCYLICGHNVQTFNSLSQDPCTVAAYMLSTCNGGCQYYYLSCQSLPTRPFAAFVINPLQPGYSYSGPSGSDDTDLCECNTIAYSLISACDACQGEEWISYGPHCCPPSKSLGSYIRPY